jgi:RNA polymerase sigma factor for flagellar operon FliA
VRVAASVARLEVRDELILANVPLVKSLAQRLARRLPLQVSVEDLVSAGVIGLVDAAGRYKPTLGVPFQAFARRRVQGAMLDALRGLDWAPRSLRRLRRSVDAAIASERARLEREPDEREIAAALGMTADQYGRALEDLRTLEVAAVRELDAPTADGVPLLELCVDPGEGQAQQLERQELRALLAEAIAELPERERQILALYYQEELTLAQIGDVIGVCESRVCQLRGLAVSRLRTLLRSALGLEEGLA